MTLYLLIIIFVLSAVSLHIQLILGIKSQFDKVAIFFLIYVMVHALHAGIVRLLPDTYNYIDRAAPFGLLYGPMLYLALKTSMRGSKVPPYQFWLHALPFLLALPVYILYLISDTFKNYWSIYRVILYGTMSLSWISYAVWVESYNIRKKAKGFSDNSNLVLTMSIVLFSLGLFMLLLVVARMTTKEAVESGSSGAFIFFFMLIVITSVYMLLMKTLTDKVTAGNNTFVNNESDNIFSLKNNKTDAVYQKSKIQDDVLFDYLSRINKYMETKPYLDPEFNLNRLSHDLKIYKHHLSQVFSKEYGQSFTTFVNTKRIEYACSLLKRKTPDCNIEELAERCGFSSKASFYRNFNEIMGDTPAKYMKSNLSIEDKMDTKTKDNL